MSGVLCVQASARGTERSLTRGLAALFLDRLTALRPDLTVATRDLAQAPVPQIGGSWIAAAFTPPAERSPALEAELALSDELIGEIEAADLIVIAAPIYNYGPPAALKAWIDQTARLGRTFSFDLARGDYPLAPILSGKRLVVLSACGEFGFAAGGPRAAINGFDPVIDACRLYWGVAAEDHHLIRIEYQEFGDERFRVSRDAAEARVHAVAGQLAATLPRALGPEGVAA